MMFNNELRAFIEKKPNHKLREMADALRRSQHMCENQLLFIKGRNYYHSISVLYTKPQQRDWTIACKSIRIHLHNTCISSYAVYISFIFRSHRIGDFGINWPFLNPNQNITLLNVCSCLLLGPFMAWKIFFFDNQTHRECEHNKIETISVRLPQILLLNEFSPTRVGYIVHYLSTAEYVISKLFE